jgi:hypothetical protein
MAAGTHVVLLLPVSAFIDLKASTVVTPKKTKAIPLQMTIWN